MQRFLIFALVLVMSFSAQAQGDKSFDDDVVTYFKTGNSSSLAGFFSSNLDLTIQEIDDVYSRAQAEQILKKFFNNHKPTNFTIIHRGTSKMDIRYFIGKLETDDEKFRVTLHVKEISGKNFIQQLRIETADFDF